jgi:hypothetical protein
MARRGRPTAPVVLTADERETLERWAGSAPIREDTAEPPRGTGNVKPRYPPDSLAPIVT